MDVGTTSTGEKLAAASGIALILIMFIFDWFGVSVKGAEQFGFGAVGGNAWESFGFIDIILFITAVAAIALAVMAANQSDVGLPVAMSAIVTGLGILSVLLVLFRIISPPDFGAPSSADDFIDVSRKIGVFLGLLCTIGIAAGGWMTMQEEGTSFGDMGGGGQAPPPPPPPAGGGPAA